MKKELFPSIKFAPKRPTPEEIDKVSAEMVKIWLDPPETLVGYAVDGEFRDVNGSPYTEDTVGAVAVTTREAHLSTPWITRKALDASDIDEERKGVLGTMKHLLHRAEQQLFDDKHRIEEEIMSEMRHDDAPMTKVELDSRIEEKHIQVSAFTQSFMDAVTGKTDVDFFTFKTSVGAGDLPEEPVAPKIEPIIE
jgi:hypothetical protein